MKPISKILVPHDFSEPAEQALELAADLARRYEASLTVAHVGEPHLYSVPEAYGLYQSDELQTFIGELDKKLNVVAEKLSARGAMQVATCLLAGDPAEEIVRAAAQGRYDLIVMGTHGRKGLERIRLGSVTERVVRAAPCPVVTIRSPRPTTHQGADGSRRQPRARCST